MTHFVIKYRENSFPIEKSDIKCFDDLKTAVSKKKNMKSENFELHRPSIKDFDKLISINKSEDIVFEMVDVIIRIRVKFDGKTYTMSVNENMTIYDFKKEICKTYAIDESTKKCAITCDNQLTTSLCELEEDKMERLCNDFYLYYSDIVLDETKTLLSNGVEDSSTIKATRKITYITVKYGNGTYRIKADLQKTVHDFKDLVSRATKVPIEGICLENESGYLSDEYPMYEYCRDGCDFIMTDMTIHVTVELRDKKYPFQVDGSMRIEEFKDKIMTQSQFSGDMYLYYDNRVLAGSDTIASSGVVSNSVIKAVPNQHNQKVSVKYREDTYTINIKQKETVIQLKEEVSKLTKLRPGNFSLQQDNICLSDNKEVSAYLKNGNTYRMVNVIIKIFADVNGILIPLYVNESMKISDLKKRIIDESGVANNLILQYKTDELVGPKTILESGLKDGYVVIAVIENVNRDTIQTLTVMYRDESYEIDIDTSKTVLDLKKAVGELTQLNENNFSLEFRGINYEDSKPISEYLKYGTNVSLSDVTINVEIRLNEQTFRMSVKEEIKVGDFIKQIIEKTKVDNVSYLMVNGEKLKDEDTLMESKVLHNLAVLALPALLGGYMWD